MRQFAGWFGTINDFLDIDHQALSEILENYHIESLNLTIADSQRTAWIECFRQLQNTLERLIRNDPTSAEWSIVLEYQLPRERGRRPDVVILVPGKVLVLEFKSVSYTDPAHVDQVACYARDLQNYHSESRDLEVLPILVLDNLRPAMQLGNVCVTSATSLLEVLMRLKQAPGVIPDARKWIDGDYAPLPSVVAAARLIFRNEQLPRIQRAHSAGIPQAHAHMQAITKRARDDGRRHLILVTGVPGSGKTLLGLQSVYADHFGEGLTSKHAVFLSGNIPLIAVLQDALRSSVFVQDVHGFLLQYGETGGRLPMERIVIFDEAQRAWDADKVYERRQSRVSEPHEFIRIGQNLPDWAVMVGLIGEGQEIYNGEESGLKQWDEALSKTTERWVVHCPSSIAPIFKHASVEISETLNLNATLRSHSAADLHQWVDAILNADLVSAAALAKSLASANYNLYCVRNFDRAKRYVKERYETELDKRYGLVASSKANTFLEKKVGITRVPPVKFFRHGKWYNAETSDPKSCCALETAASEFNCQGLELDLPIVCWAPDLLYQSGHWQSPKPRANSKAKNPHQLRLNSYRVLLTRGRDGMIMWVPEYGEFDATYGALIAAGAQQLEDYA
jgi:hypothetical protein